MGAKGLLERLNDGETVIVAEGYLYEFERRGYLKAGAFVPEVVVEHPDLVRALHEEFAHAGSDVIEAFTYYGHRTKLQVIGREDELEKLNRDALRIARKVADETGTLMAGNICNTCSFLPDNPSSAEKTKGIFKEQIEWAMEEGADYIIAETFGEIQEARIALECIKQYGKGLPAVVTMAVNNINKVNDENMSFPDAIKELEDRGADVVGVNCVRGPDTMIDIIKEVREKCKGHVACLPAPYRTSKEDGLCLQNLKDQKTGEMSFPGDLDSWLCSRSHMASFAKQLNELGVRYVGICCGNRASYTRSMAEALGRSPPASKYSPDMSQHISQIAKVEGEDSFARKRWYNTYGRQQQTS